MIPVHDTPLMWKNLHSSATFGYGIGLREFEKNAPADWTTGLDWSTDIDTWHQDSSAALEHEHSEISGGRAGSVKPHEAHIMQLARCSVRISACYTVARGIKLKNLIILHFLQYRDAQNR